MIFLDSSFTIEWLLGTPRAAKVKLPAESMAILPMQYAEILVFFLRQGEDLTAVTQELGALEIQYPHQGDLIVAADLYHQARQKKSKASLADALLAATALQRDEKLFSFDQDFAYLGFRGQHGCWRPLR